MRMTPLIELLICLAIVGVITVMVLSSGIFAGVQEAVKITESPSFYYHDLTPEQIAEQDVIHIIPWSEEFAD